MDTMNFSPIGVFNSSEGERYSFPRQPTLSQGNMGKIVLHTHCNYEQALQDLDGFDRVWILFCFHRNKTWKPKVLPPRGGVKRGVFATRSPHRPNPIGFSCVELVEVKGRELTIRNHDLLDIKPYIDYADSFSSKSQGWLDEMEEQVRYSITWSEKALAQRDFLQGECGVRIEDNIASRLEINPYPYPNNRIRELPYLIGTYEMAYKTWRIVYKLCPEKQELCILEITSGYDKDVLSGKLSSRWDDVGVHVAFLERFLPKK
jgi:tRNA-Thr(GGU) m(6)t(6)A37 methyltransferase TsaA